jgi:predicted DNA-binding transcriptional regulator AlpA
MHTRDEQPAGSKVLRPRAAAEYLSICEAALRRRAKADPTFPQPRKLGPRTTVFFKSELDDFLSKLARGI